MIFLPLSPTAVSLLPEATKGVNDSFRTGCSSDVALCMPDKLVNGDGEGKELDSGLVSAVKLFLSALYIISFFVYSFTMLAAYSYAGFPRDVFGWIILIYPSVYLLYCLCSILLPIGKAAIIALAVIFNLPVVGAIVYYELRGEEFMVISFCYVLLSVVISGVRVYFKNITLAA